MFLGKPVRSENNEVWYYHRGAGDALPNSEKLQLTKALWRFMAEHGPHSLVVQSSYDEDFDTITAYPEIGGDTLDDISFEDYLRNWPG